jgi:hypothetical protein
MNVVLIILLIIAVFYLADFFQLMLNYAAFKFYRAFFIGLLVVLLCWYFYPGEVAAVFIQVADGFRHAWEVTQMHACRANFTYFCPRPRF